MWHQRLQYLGTGNYLRCWIRYWIRVNEIKAYKKELFKKHIIICSDNQFVIMALRTSEKWSLLVVDCTEKLGALSKKNQVCSMDTWAQWHYAKWDRKWASQEGGKDQADRTGTLPASILEQI